MGPPNFVGTNIALCLYTAYKIGSLSLELQVTHVRLHRTLKLSCFVKAHASFVEKITNNIDTKMW